MPVLCASECRQLYEHPSVDTRLTQEVQCGSQFCGVGIIHLEVGHEILQRGIQSPNLAIIEFGLLLRQPGKNSSEEQLRVGCKGKVCLDFESVKSCYYEFYGYSLVG
jgi:hypothetical protein